jgi:hypothetical protein
MRGKMFDDDSEFTVLTVKHPEDKHLSDAKLQLSTLPSIRNQLQVAAITI